MNTLVSIVIPTENSARVLEDCLISIHHQTYKNIEIIIVDGESSDHTTTIAKKYRCKIYVYIPKVKKFAYDASHKRNYGAIKARGDFIYWVDADMRLPSKLIAEALSLSKQNDAVVVPENSIGTSVWARAKNLERRCYWHDDTVESMRFIKRTTWKKTGGFDESLGAGGDDLDLHRRVLEAGYTVGRTKSIVIHDEGNLSLTKLFKKRFRYGRDILNYLHKRPKSSIVSFFPIHMSYIRNWRLFIDRPVDTLFFVIMRTTEYVAGFLGIVYSIALLR